MMGGCAAVDMGRKRFIDSLIRVLSGLRDGDLAAAEYLNDELLWHGLEFHSRAIGGSAKVCWVVDFCHYRYVKSGFLSTLDAELRQVNAIQTSLNNWLESGRRTFAYAFAKPYLDETWFGPHEEPSEDSTPSYAVVVSAVVLLALVYHYLAGNVDSGGSKAFSRSSLDFRDIYVAIVLFLGAYVWIKFREVAPRGTGVLRRELPDGQGGTKVRYDARLKPPMWNRQKVRRLELGRFATWQEAHNKFLIAASYYNGAPPLLDGWFPVLPMSAEGRSRNGEDKRKWVIAQAKKVYEDFENEKALRLGVLVDQAAPGHGGVNVDPRGASSLNSAEHQQPALASRAENSGIGMPMIGDNGSTSHFSDGVNEDLALPNGFSLGSQEGSALPVSPPNIESGTSLNGSDQLGLLQSHVRTLQQQISDQQQQIQGFGAQILQLRGSEQFFLLQTRLDTFEQQISDRQQQVQEFGAQILQLQQQQRIQQQQQLQESRIPNPQWSYQSYLQEQRLQDVNQGVPGFDMEMEQSLEQNYSGFMATLPDEGEVQEGFWDTDTLFENGA